MHGTNNFREFCQRFGNIPIREVVGVALVLFVFFLIAYVPFLLIVLPASLVAKSWGIYKIVAALFVLLYFLGLLRDRKSVVAQLKEFGGMFTEAPRWIMEFFVLGIIGALLSLLWLPFWLVFGMLVSVVCIAEFLMKTDELGREYSEKVGPSRA